MEHKHTADEERRIRELALDETLAETFPASDSPSTLPNPDDDTLLPDGAPANSEQPLSAPKDSERPGEWPGHRTVNEVEPT